MLIEPITDIEPERGAAASEQRAKQFVGASHTRKADRKVHRAADRESRWKADRETVAGRHGGTNE